jgi:type III pantothenate kinase
MKDKEILAYKRQKKLLVGDIKKLHRKYSFSRVILSTVRSSLPPFYKYLDRSFKTVLLSHKTPQAFKSLYKTPKTIGKDRIAAVSGAIDMFPKQNCLIFDIGTCMTADFVDKKAIYHGGNISPGIDLRLKSMHHFTSALPLVKGSFKNKILGLSTKSALQNGAIYGIVLEIEALAKRIEREFGKINVILTGGDASSFGDLVECKKFVVPNLVLMGLNATLNYNE